MKTYLMSEVMEELNITRETLKYYEKLQLITPHRTEKKYRVYDEISLYKIKLIRDLKNLGVEYEEIKELIENFSVQMLTENIRKRIDIIKHEILQKKILLNELNAMAKESFDWNYFYENFSIVRNVIVCEKCCKKNVGDVYSHNIHGVQVFKIDDEKNIEKGRYLKNTLFLVQNDYPNDCRMCPARVEIGSAWRGTIKYENDEQLKARLKEIFLEGLQLEYYLDNEIYCVKSYYKEEYEGCFEEGIAVDIYIPFKN